MAFWGDAGIVGEAGQKGQRTNGLYSWMNRLFIQVTEFTDCGRIFFFLFCEYLTEETARHIDINTEQDEMEIYLARN